MVFGQENGWEPEALLNWLAVTGWGTSANSENSGVKSAPDSTAILSLGGLIEEVKLQFKKSSSF